MYATFTAEAANTPDKAEGSNEVVKLPPPRNLTEYTHAEIVGILAPLGKRGKLKGIKARYMRM